MGLADDIERERQACADTLEAVGPDAPTLCTPWTAADVAAHLSLADGIGRYPVFVARTAIARWGLRVGQPAARMPRVASAPLRRARRKGFQWAIGRIRQPPPPLHSRPAVAPVSLFEIWGHHQDVLRANGLSGSTRPDLVEVIPWALRYHRRPLRGLALAVEADDGRTWEAGSGESVVVRGAIPELVLWLTGRHTVADVEVSGGPRELGRRLRM